MRGFSHSTPTTMTPSIAASRGSPCARKPSPNVSTAATSVVVPASFRLPGVGRRYAAIAIAAVNDPRTTDKPGAPR
jgi:hypothetical protein